MKPMVTEFSGQTENSVFFTSKFQKIVSKFQKYREVEIVKKCFNENRNKEEHKKLNFK